MKLVTCLFLLACLRETVCCSCAYVRSRFDAICTGYTESASVYRANVVSAYCKCTTSTTQFSCINFYSSSNGTVVNSYSCTGDTSLLSSYDTCSNVVGSGITVANATATVGIDCNEFGYYNGNNSGCDLTYQPCYYTVRVEEVYKGNLQIGQLLNTPGPDALTTCGQYGRVLSVGTSYIVGIGGGCSSINSWTDVTNYQTIEINSLRGGNPCTNVAVILGTVIPLFIIIVIICLIILIVIVVKYKSRNQQGYKSHVDNKTEPENDDHKTVESAITADDEATDKTSYDDNERVIIR